jgi:predicted alpha/beta-hydrolase family hydrolase
VPVLFVSGTRDPLAGQAALQQAAKKVKGPVTFHWLETADHGFRPLKSSGQSIDDALAESARVSVEWVQGLPG